MKIFVAGGTGFIGGRLLQTLAGSGHEVRCLVRSASRAEPLRRLGMQIVPGDLSDRRALRAGMDGCDWVFDLAGMYSMWLPDRSLFERVNVQGTRNLLETALACGVRKVVRVSTVAVFGKPEQVPFTEDCPPGPTLFSDYARSKARGDSVAWELAGRGLPLVMLYPGIVLGAGDTKASGQYILLLVNRNTPSTIYNRAYATYVYVGDVARAVLRAAEKEDNLGERYLLGGEQLNGAQYARLICELAGVPQPFFHLPDWFLGMAAYLFTGMARFTRRPPWWTLSIDAHYTLKNGFRFDGSKAARELGIEYTPIRAALSEAIHSYRQEPAGSR